jgi:membrane protein
MQPRHTVKDHRSHRGFRTSHDDRDAAANSRNDNSSDQPSSASTSSDTKGDHQHRGRPADKPSDIPKPGWKDILWRTKEQMEKDNLSIVSAGVAFYIFLGLIPALGALISIWGLVADPLTIQEQINSMAGFLPQEVIKMLNEQMARIAGEPTGATLGAIIGVLLALWSGAKAMKAVMMALNITYEENETRGFIRLNLSALALTLAGILGFMLAIGIIVALPIVLEKIGLDSTATTIVKIVRWPLLALFAMLGLGILYRYAPDRDPARWRWVSWGAFVATLLWLAVSAGFSFYASNFGNYNKTYGSLGAVVVVLLWFLISAYVVLLGAELNAEMEHQTERDTTTGPDQPRGQRHAYVAGHTGESRRN